MTSEPLEHPREVPTPTESSGRWTKFAASCKKLMQGLGVRRPGFDGDLPQAYRVDPEEGDKSADEFCKSR